MELNCVGRACEVGDIYEQLTSTSSEVQIRLQRGGGALKPHWTRKVM